MRILTINLSVSLTPRGVFGAGCGVLAVLVVGNIGLAAMGGAIAIPAALVGYAVSKVAMGVYDDAHTLYKSVRMSKDVKSFFNKSANVLANLF